VIQYHNIIIHLGTGNCISLHSVKIFSLMTHLSINNTTYIRSNINFPVIIPITVNSNFEMAPTRCTWCNQSPQAGEVPFKICGGCRWEGNDVGEERSVCYCGQQCQRDDWRYHWLLCKKLKPFLDTEPRPSPAHKLAILLPQNEENPVLVWMRIDSSHGFESAETDPILGPSKRGSFAVNHVPASMQLEQAKPGARNNLDHSVQVIVHDESDAISNNTCITKVLNGNLGHFWRGPILACSQIGKYGHGVYDLDYQDFLLSDLRVVFEFFRDVRY
jgi:hypothetical protein